MKEKKNVAVVPASVEATPVVGNIEPRLSEPPHSGNVRMLNKLTGIEVTLSASAAASMVKSNPLKFEITGNG